MREARQQSVELAFNDPKCIELQKEVETQIAEAERIRTAELQEYERKKADEATRKNSATKSNVGTSTFSYSAAYKSGYQVGFDHGSEMVTYHSLMGSSEDESGIAENLRLYQSGGVRGSSDPEWIEGFKEGCRKGLGKYYRK